MRTKILKWRRALSVAVVALATITTQFTGVNFAHATGGAPTNFAAVYSTSGGTPHVNLSWTSDGSSDYTVNFLKPGLSNYDVCDASGTDISTTSSTSMSVYSFSLADSPPCNSQAFTNGTTLNFYVTDGTDPNATPVSSTTVYYGTDTFASVPQNVTVVQGTNNSLTTTWAAPATAGTLAITGYQVTTFDSTTSTQVGQVTVTNLTYTFTGATVGNKYFTEVAAINGTDGPSPNVAASADITDSLTTGSLAPKAPDTAVMLPTLLNPVTIAVVGIAAAAAVVFASRLYTRSTKK